MASNIHQLLDELGLGKYADVFGDNEIDLDAARYLSDDDLKELGLPMGPRRKFAAAIEKLATSTSEQAREASPDIAVSSHSSEAERRQLTVMFCDLVGSTALSQKLDPEDLRDVMRRYQDTATAAVERYGGFVAKFLGDGALAYFGWPQAHEDQTERAIRAGLDVIDAIQQIRLDDGSTLRARGGIATGQVVIGDLVGDSAQETDAVIGETPNLAARLQEVAGHGQLVVDATTQRLVGNRFEMEDLGAVPIKGFAEPQSAWRVEGVGGGEVRFEEARNAAMTKFIGRRNELGLLHETWQQAQDGEGQLLLLSGEAGIGKSRLVQTFLEKLSSQTHLRLRYQCSSFHTNSTLYPIIQHLRRAVEAHGGETLDDQLDGLEQVLRQEVGGKRRKTLALFASLLSLPSEHRYGPLDMPSQQRKERILQTLIEQLLVLSQHEPVLFLMEDAHWIDPTSQELLERSIPMIAAAPIFMVVTHRPEWRPNWTEVYGNVSSLSLGRMPRAMAMQMVQSIITDASTSELVERIASRTDGIPLYIEEITKAALESAEPAEGPDTGVPETLQTSLLARLDRLGDAKALAQVGAVIGREFSYDLLRRVAQQTPEELDQPLSRIVRSGLLFQKGAPPSSVYTFKHALVQDAAYNSLLRRSRRRLHGAIAKVLETGLPGRAETEPELLAHHYTEADLIATAVPHWQRAGRHAADRSANIEAIAHFTKGLDLLAKTEETRDRFRQELALRAGLGVPMSATKGPGDAENYANYERARALCEQFDDVPELYQVHWGCWRANLAIGKLDEARNLADHLLKLAERQQDDSLLIEAHHAQWTTFSRVHEPLECWKQAEQGIALYDSEKHHRHVYTITDHDAGVCCRCFGALSLWQLGYPDRALALVDEALALARRLEHPTSMTHALSHSAWLHQVRRDHDIVIERAAEIDSFATEHGFSQYVATSQILKGWSLTRLGRGEEGLDLMTQGIDSGQAKGTGQSNAYFLHLLADAYLQLDQVQNGLNVIDKALVEVDQTGVRAFEPEMHRVRAELLRCNGDLDASQEFFERAMSLAEAASARLLQLRAAAGLAAVWRDEGRESDARGLLEPIYGWFSDGLETDDLLEAGSLLNSLN